MAIDKDNRSHPYYILPGQPGQYLICCGFKKVGPGGVPFKII